MIMYFKILLLQFLVGLKVGQSLPIAYFSKNKLNRIGARIKFDRSTSSAVRHSVSGKVVRYAYDYNSVSIMISSSGIVIDHWKGNTLYTYHGCQFSPKGFWKKLKFMTSFFSELVRKIDGKS
jgi:hypothetical protein